jgi:alanine racemase
MALLSVFPTALQQNYRLLREMAGVPLLPVLKADAYGHGADVVFAALQKEGVPLYALANEHELFALLSSKKAKKSLQEDGQPSFLLLGPCEKDAVTHLSSLPVHLTVHSLAYARLLENEMASHHPSGKLAIHLKLETGMHRLGLSESEAERVLSLPHLSVTGVYSHFAEAAEDAERTLAQTARFTALCRRLALPKGVFRHLSAGAALLRYGALGLEGGRVGLPLYGVCPQGTSYTELTPVMRFAARTLTVHSLAAGEGMGYGTFRAPRDMRVAVIDAGYADGVPPCAAKAGARITVKGTLCPLVGEVCMDRTFVRIDDLPLSEGEEVTLFGATLGDTERFAREAEVSPYHLLVTRSLRTVRTLRH